MSVSIWQADDTQPWQDVDFLVIGAGLAGCTAAYFAAQAGHDVVITDAKDLAFGASSRNAGFMITGLDTYYHRALERYGSQVVREMWDISQKSIRYWREFAQMGDVRLDECGSMLLAETEEEAQELAQAARAMEANGLTLEFIEGDPLGRGYHAAIRQPQDAAVQPYELVQTICQASGARLIPNNELYALEQPDEEIVIAYTRQFRFRARYVMLCTNAYSPFVHPYFVGKVIPTRAQVLVTAPLKNGPVVGTCGYSDYGYMYYRDTFDGRLLIGGGRNHYREQEHDTADDRVTDPIQQTLEAYLRRRFPDVDAPIERRWAGIMGFSVDGLPLVGTLPQMSRVGFAVGFTGHGLSLGAATVERAVDHLLNGAPLGAVDAARLH